MESKPYIDWDIEEVKALKAFLTENMRLIKEFLPEGVNWDSPKQVKEFVTNKLGIVMEDVKIETLKGVMEKLDHDSESFDIINGYDMYLRQKYSISNYLDCVLKHHESGRVYLRHHEGQWVLPNRRPLSGSPEIVACETGREGV